jgi:hypothetical protein
MKATTWFRAAAVMMLLFALGHTLGFLTFTASTAEGRAVFASMNGVHFSSGNSTFSYGGFYRGFGLTITVFQLFLAWMSWTLGSLLGEGAVGVQEMAWGLCALQTVSVVLSLKYFSAVPASFSLIAAICFAMAAISVKKQRAVTV